MTALICGMPDFLFGLRRNGEWLIPMGVSAVQGVHTNVLDVTVVRGLVVIIVTSIR